jgi:hypothetical protein
MRMSNHPLPQLWCHHTGSRIQNATGQPNWLYPKKIAHSQGGLDTPLLEKWRLNPLPRAVCISVPKQVVLSSTLLHMIGCYSAKTLQVAKSCNPSALQWVTPALIKADVVHCVATRVGWAAHRASLRCDMKRHTWWQKRGIL